MLGRSSLAGTPASVVSPQGFPAVSPFAPSQAKINVSSQLLSGDQHTSFHATMWDTPFTALEGTVASRGLVLAAREPLPNSDWKGYRDAVAAAAAAGVAAAFLASPSTGLVSDGRSPQVLDSWGAGSPAWYGNSQRGRVALSWSGVLKPVVGRSWFTTASSFTMSLACAGQGFVRVVRRPLAGGTYDVLSAYLTETDYLTGGPTWSPTFTVAPGDALDVYFVQNGEEWGGLVVKAVLGSVQTEALAAAAPVLGCDLFDDGAPPAPQALKSIESVQVTHELGLASTAMLSVPLINPKRHDGVGYEWRRSSDGDDPGYLVHWQDGQPAVTLKRGQLVQVAGGLVNDEYTLFTGFIDDFEPPKNGLTTIRCVGLERRPIKDTVRNEPDELSYMIAGYRKLSGSTEPVYGIAAYDNWAIESAVRDVLLRAGVNSSRMQAPYFVTKYDGTSASVTYGTDTFTKFRARGVLGNLLRCERSVRYGNVGFAFQDFKPADDPYVFKPDDSKDAWSRVRDIADRYGYDIRFDNVGDCVLQSRGNASTVVDVNNSLSTGPAGTKKVHPSAFKGTYYEWSGAQNPAVQFAFTGSRVDVTLPRGANLGNWGYMRVVRTSDEFEVSRVRNLGGTAPSDIFFYDYRTATDGKNATVVTLYSGPYDTYRVECLGIEPGPLSTSGDGLVRRLDAFFVYAKDPLMPLYPRPLSTAENALSVDGTTTSDEQRNLVYVVGHRKATVTDSEKLTHNPNNPEPEFIVSVGVDVASINDPTARNYTGARHAAAIFDTTITDPDYANYLSRTFIYRYRSPRPPADITHTILPVLELRDPLFAVEAQFRSVNEFYVLWATRFTHRFERTGAATTQISTSSWPEFASYELRDDIDIDADFGGVPIANVAVQYTSLTGQVRTNLASKDVVQASGAGDIMVSTVNVTSGTPDFLDMAGLDWPPVPGTLFLTPPGLEGGSSTTVFPVGIGSSNVDASSLLTLLPGGSVTVAISTARRITSVLLSTWRPSGVGGGGQPLYSPDQLYVVPLDRQDATSNFFYEWDESVKTLRVRWKVQSSGPGLLVSVQASYATSAAGPHGDFLADNPYHHFTNIDYRASGRKVYLPWKQGDGSAVYQRNTAHTSYTVKYRRLWQNFPSGALKDPYNGVSPFYDPTTSQLGYLVSLTFDALVTGFYRISVRSVHDDTIVAYLTEPTADPNDEQAHWQYVSAGVLRSFNWDGVDQIGVWNKRQSADYSAAQQGTFELTEKESIGAGWYVWNRERDGGKLGELALISADVDATTGQPVFGQGTYAAWYYHIEVQNDNLEQIHANAVAAGTPAKPYPRLVKTREPSGTEVAPIYTTGSAGVVYTHLPEPSMGEMTTQDWVAAFDYDPSNSTHATTDANWGAPDTDATFHNAKPVRVQFTLKPRPGVLWSTKQGEAQVKLTRHAKLRALIFDQFAVTEGGNYPDTTVPQRTVYSRRTTEDEHTLDFNDAGWRKAKTLRNSGNSAGTVQWVFRPADFRKKFRDIENESVDFGNYLQLAEVPKYDLHRAVAGSTSRFIIGFMGYLFYLSAWLQDRSGRRMWFTNRQFLDKSKIANNAYADWWNPASPTTAATATTYRADWQVDPLRQQRRTVVCRQWTNEPNWQAAQRTRWGFSPLSIGDLLLRHKWQDHDPASANIALFTWPVMDQDNHSRWHRDAGRTELPAAFGTLTRQLGTASTTRLGNWTWETGPTWVPCITRDFHGHFLLPPMADPETANLQQSESYASVDSRAYDSPSNEGGDVGAAPVWSSWARDMNETYVSGANGTVRFKAGFRINTAQDPNKPTLSQNAMDYVRQADMVHYEDIRGFYSRGPRPAEQPKKVTPGMPYFLNLYRYTTLVRPIKSLPENQQNNTRYTTLQPKFKADCHDWFRMTMRREYVVESERFFPTDNVGVEQLIGLNPEKTRYLTFEQASVHYDAGAWVGWKEDLPSGTLIGWNDGTGTGGNVFNSGSMPVALGPALPETTDVYMHLVLVNERRAVTT